MLVGDVIRKYRKQVGITQEEMARRLGVTTPAVNKWENNNTQPDIALLAPIARLLGITTDTLLSFRDSLSSEEIAAFVKNSTRIWRQENMRKCLQRLRRLWKSIQTVIS